VNVNVIVPAAVSALLGVYVGFRILEAGENVPLPLVVQFPAPVVEVAESVTAPLLAHTVCELPAFATGVTLTTTTSVPMLLVQPFNVTVTE
jgi:hypothetical protein